MIICQASAGNSSRREAFCWSERRYRAPRARASGRDAQGLHKASGWDELGREHVEITDVMSSMWCFPAFIVIRQFIAGTSRHNQQGAHSSPLPNIYPRCPLYEELCNANEWRVNTVCAVLVILCEQIKPLPKAQTGYIQATDSTSQQLLLLNHVLF